MRFLILILAMGLSLQATAAVSKCAACDEIKSFIADSSKKHNAASQNLVFERGMDLFDKMLERPVADAALAKNVLWLGIWVLPYDNTITGTERAFESTESLRAAVIAHCQMFYDAANELVSEKKVSIKDRKGFWEMYNLPSDCSRDF